MNGGDNSSILLVHTVQSLLKPDFMVRRGLFSHMPNGKLDIQHKSFFKRKIVSYVHVISLKDMPEADGVRFRRSEASLVGYGCSDNTS